MPLVKINLVNNKTAEFKNKLGDLIHESIVETANVPVLDKFQIINECKIENFIFDKTYQNMNRTDDLIIIEIILNKGRTTEVKKNLYNAISTKIENKLKISKDDILISLQEVEKENWSFGKGLATYI